MALAWVDGFEVYTTPQFLARKYSVSNIGGSTFVAGRISGRALNFNGAALTTAILGNSATYYIGFAFQNVNLNSAGPIVILQIMDVSTIQCYLGFDPNTGLCSFFRGTTTLGTGTKFLVSGVWYYLEIQATINSSTGVLTLKNNQVVDISLTSINNKVSSNSYSNTFNWSRNNATLGQYRLDDIYICDTTTSLNNTFLGDMKVELLVPTGNGNSTMWTPSGINSNWTCADALNDGNFLTSNVPGTYDLYSCSSLSTVTSSIAGAQVTVWARNTDATQHQIASAIYSGSTTAFAGATATVNDTAIQSYSFIQSIDPNTSTTWTPTSINSAQFGVKLVT